MFRRSENIENARVAARLTASGFVVRALKAACRPHLWKWHPPTAQTRRVWRLLLCLQTSDLKSWLFYCSQVAALFLLSNCNSSRMLMILLLLCYATRKKLPKKYRIKHLGHFVLLYFFKKFNLSLLKSSTNGNICTASSSSSSLISFSFQSETRMFNGVDKECPSPTEKLARKESLKVLVLSAQSRDCVKCLSAIMAALVTMVLSLQLRWLEAPEFLRILYWN